MTRTNNWKDVTIILQRISLFNDGVCQWFNTGLHPLYKLQFELWFNVWNNSHVRRSPYRNTEKIFVRIRSTLDMFLRNCWEYIQPNCFDKKKHERHCLHLYERWVLISYLLIFKVILIQVLCCFGKCIFLEDILIMKSVSNLQFIIDYR